MKNITPWGLKVRKKLLDRGMSVEDLAKIVGAPKGSVIRDIIYGLRPGYKYVESINVFLEIS